MNSAKGNASVAASKDEACLRKFLAGNKTLFTKAFWENGPRQSAGEKEMKPVVSTDR